MKEEITAIRATSSSPDHSVTVVAGPGGAVLDIQITEQALQSGSARQLSSSIMSALRLAVADGARQQAAIVQRYVGDRMNIVDRVMATQKEFLGDKIEAGEQEEERLREQQQPQLPEEDGQFMRSEQPTAPSWSQVQPRRPARQQQTSDDDEGFQGIGGGDER